MLAPETLDIAVYQNASADAEPQFRLDALDHALAGHSGPRPRLVVCSELFLSGYGAGARLADLAEQRRGPFWQGIAAIAKRHECTIVYGYPETGGEGLYNAAAVIGSDGSDLANHRKMVFPTDYEKKWFRSGEPRLTFFSLGGWKIAVVVCYEMELPEIVRACAANGAHLVVAPTALTRQWDVVSRKLVPTRAFENGIYVAYANHSGTEGKLDFLGDSCIVGPDGRDLVRAGPDEALIGATLDRASIDSVRSRLPYLVDSENLGGLRATSVLASGRGNLSPEKA